MRTLFLASLAFGIASCTTAQPPTPPVRMQPAAASVAFSPASGLQAVNSYRTARGLGAVRLDPQLMQAAASHSAAMRNAGQMSHDVGGDFSSRLSAHGIARVVAVENIAAGQRSLGEVMHSWQNSYGHAANLSNPSVTRFGMAVSGGYWTLIMAGDPR